MKLAFRLMHRLWIAFSMKVHRLAWIAAALLSVLRVPCSAQSTPSANSSEYQHLIRTATQEFESGNFGEAHALFERAHRLDPNARTWRGLGYASFELRHYLQATQEFSAALNDQKKPLTDTQRKQAEELVDRAKTYLATVDLEVSPPQAKLWLDGQPAHGRTLIVDPGEHQLSARADGFRDAELRWSLDSGEHRTLQVNLQRMEASADAPSPAPTSVMSTQHADRPAPSASMAPYVVLAASGAVAVAGGVLIAFSLADTSRVEHASKGTNWADIKGAYDRAPALMTAGAVLLGIGVAGATTGLVWMSSTTTESAVAVTLRVGPSGAVELRGTF
jgi:hypothetical protein